ncbi:MAG: GH3 auxin-responsive promoter family protein [bacterium]|nr:GH3 auxin-responsive promoter family protein [bacterium]
MFSDIKTRYSFELIYQFSKPGYYRYRNALADVETAQRRVLSELLEYSSQSAYGKRNSLHKDMSWEEFSARIPVTDYKDWESLVSKQMEFGDELLSGEECERYQPTSGSTSKVKWIPYTNRFLAELDRAVSPMVVDVLAKQKHLLTGKQYWSLSWMPTEYRNESGENMNDDSKLLPWYKRILVEQTMVVPNEISFAPTSDGALFATLAYLAAARNLTVISVWSPTFALNMFEQLSTYRQELADVLRSGKWGAWTDELSFLSCPRSAEASSVLRVWDGNVTSDFLKKFWPNVSMISSWDTSTSAIWARELKELFPDAEFQGKGLWTTEGIITMPFEGKYPLAVTSHFYEFIDLETGTLHPSWDLQKGQVVKPLISTGSGFFRYAINDRLKVVDFIKTCPCFEFQGRIDEVDMVGEKIAPGIAMSVLNRAGDRYSVRALSLLAIAANTSGKSKPYYLLLCEEDNSFGEMKKEVAEYADSLLRESFHFKLARDLNQLAPTKVLFHPDARKLYQQIAETRGMILGDMKIEPLLLLTEEELEESVKKGAAKEFNSGQKNLNFELQT